MSNEKDRVKHLLTELRSELEFHLEEDGLATNGILDSLDIMNLIMKLEGEFDIEIDPEDVLSENFESVDSMIALIEKCQGE